MARSTGTETGYEYDARYRLTKITEADPDGAGSQLAPVTRFASNFRSLIESYWQRIQACDLSIYGRWGYEYETLSHGQRIRPAWREAIRTDFASIVDVADPFDVTNQPNLLSVYQNLVAAKFAGRKTWKLAQLHRFRRHPFVAPFCLMVA